MANDQHSICKHTLTHNPFPATMICERTLVAVHRKLNKPAGISCNICQTSCHNFRGPSGPCPGHVRAAARVNCNKLINKGADLLRECNLKLICLNNSKSLKGLITLCHCLDGCKYSMGNVNLDNIY